MRVAVNSHALPIYKENRIASLLCIFETTISGQPGTFRSVFLVCGGSESIYSQQNDAVITPIARGIVFLSTVLPIKDYQG